MESRFAKYLKYWYQEKTPEEREMFNFNLVPLNKYLTSGIYSISVNNHILYIGKSVNIHSRIRDHIYNIENSDEHKYQILRHLKNKGFTISFNIVERDVPEDELVEREREYIECGKPCLNSQHNKMLGRRVSLQYVLSLVESAPQYEF